MGNLIEKNNLKNVILIIISYLICFVITRLALNLSDKIYFSALTIVQGFYFLAVLITVLYIFYNQNSDKRVLIFSSIGLILYSACFYFFAKSIFSHLVSTSGIVNFIAYSSKIYFIALPLLGFLIWKLKKENTKKLCFLLIFKIIFLLVITFIFHYFFKNNGVLYSFPLSEFIFIIYLYLSKEKLLD